MRFPEGHATSRAAAAFRARRAAAGCALAAAAVLAAGCSVKGGEDANLIEGKQAFVAKCGSCHTLARANTKGTVGPNLDASFGPSVEDGLGRSSIRGTVEQQIKIPNPEGAMPKELVTGQTARNIAAYVAQSAAAGGKDSGLLATAVEAPGSGPPAEQKGSSLSIAASPSGQLSYVTNKATAKAGSFTLEMPNTSGVSHNIAIEAGSGGATGSGAVIGKTNFTTKGTASVNITLKAGTYTFFCQAPGHRAAGMFGILTVK
jgi:plastocyanin